jgi:hypothetical protein
MELCCAKSRLWSWFEHSLERKCLRIRKITGLCLRSASIRARPRSRSSRCSFVGKGP